MSNEQGPLLANADHIGVVGNLKTAGLNNFITNILNDMNMSTSATMQFLIPKEKEMFQAQLRDALGRLDRQFADEIRSGGQGGPRTHKLRFPDAMKDFANDDLREIYGYLDSARDNYVRNDSCRLHSGLLEQEYLDMKNELVAVRNDLGAARTKDTATQFVKAGPIGDREERLRETAYSEESVNPRAPIGESGSDLD